MFNKYSLTVWEYDRSRGRVRGGDGKGNLFCKFKYDRFTIAISCPGSNKSLNVLSHEILVEGKRGVRVTSVCSRIGHPRSLGS